MKKILTLFLLCLLVGCSKQPPIVVQEDVEPTDETSIKFIEEVQDNDDEILQFLEFTITDRIVTLNINDIPILSNYLKQHTDKETAIQEMQLIQMMSANFDTIFLLSFACQANSCSYLFINTETAESQLLADQAKVKKIEPTEDLEHLLVVFKRPLRNFPWDAHKLVVFETDGWTNVVLTEAEQELISLHGFRWPILNTTWLNDRELEITLPSVAVPSPAALTEWYESGDRPERNIITYID